MSFDLQMLGDVRAFSFKNVGMRVMCIVMCNAGALADDDTPPWPAWPAGVTFEHEQLLEDALDDPTREASLSREDRKLVWSKRTAIEARRRVRSRSSQKVPGFKFESNDGWIVEQDECRWIAEKLRAFAATFDAVCVADVERARGEHRRAAIEEMKRQGLSTERISPDVEPIDLSPDEWKKWILDFASFNAEASSAGYRVV